MSTTEQHQFQAETQQLLNIVIHSLYTDKEIFIRELISNAADSLEKLRFQQTAGETIVQPDLPLKITVTVDEENKTITVTDTGVGMTHDELIENLGKIAHSGSQAFLKELAENKRDDASFIGQFGVGFYAAFMVAEKVIVYTHSYKEQEGWCWTSHGTGTYEIESASDIPRGAQVVLHLREEAHEFADASKLETTIQRYSNFVPFPIEVNGKQINTVQALWTRNKNDISDQEYNEFYHYIGHDSQDPMLRFHFAADAPLAIQALLFVPQQNVETMGLSRSESEVNLYCRKVLIQAKAEGLFPEWLRFLKGVVDSADLPLNIAREKMQGTALLQRLNKVLTSRFLKFLEETANQDPETYKRFYEQYNRFLKEGVVTDQTHREALAKLLRYESSSLDRGQLTSLSDYVQRMNSDQNEIYYLVSKGRDAAEASPYYEVFAAKNLEVLFMYDPWDEIVMEHLGEFEGKKIVPAERADLQVDQPKEEKGLTDQQAEELAKWMKEALGDRVNQVRVSKRLVDSPAVAVDSQHMTSSMRQLMKQMNQQAGLNRQDLEINPRHPIMASLDKARHADQGLATKAAEQILDNSLTAAGFLEDPRLMIQRSNELLEQLLTLRSLT